MRYKPEKRVRFYSKLRTIISIVLIVIVIFVAFLIFANMKKKEDYKASFARIASEVTEDVLGEEGTSEIGADEIYIVKGNDKSSNRFGRADKLCYTDKLKYTEEDLEKLDSYGLRITRNEIYARHGRMFTEQDLQAYFDRQPWYVPTVSPEKFDDECLNAIENYNIKLIIKYEMKY